MENPIKMDVLGVYTLIFGNTHIYLSGYISISKQLTCQVLRPLPLQRPRWSEASRESSNGPPVMLGKGLFPRMLG